MTGMKKLTFAIGISLVVGFAAASWIETTLISSDTQQIDPPESGISSFDAAAPVEERIRALELAVIEEREVRQLLEVEILVLREEIEQRHTESSEPSEPDESAFSAREERREAFRARRFGVRSTQGQVDRLIEAGFPADQAAWIVQREAELQMERLQARYDAMRGNEEQVFFAQGFSQNSGLHAELGDADYERSCWLTADRRQSVSAAGSRAHRRRLQACSRAMRSFATTANVSSA